jgi:hypothetical protein
MKERAEQGPYAITKTKHEFRLVLQTRTVIVALACPFSEYTLGTHMN